MKNVFPASGLSPFLNADSLSIPLICVFAVLHLGCEHFEEDEMDWVSWSSGLDESLWYGLPTDSLSLPFSKHSLDDLSQSYNQAFHYQCG